MRPHAQASRLCHGILLAGGDFQPSNFQRSHVVKCDQQVGIGNRIVIPGMKLRQRDLLATCFVK